MADEADAIIDRMISVPTRREVVRHIAREIRCSTTDLLVSQCGCRVHRGVPAPRDPFEEAEEVAPWVPAQFDSECSGCDGALWVGDMIRADGSGGWEGKCCTDG
jgi:hypothetical protein